MATPWKLSQRTLSVIAGAGYLLIFVTAVYANFFMLESLRQHPILTLEHNDMLVRTGIIAFLIAAVADVIVAWALYELFRHHPLIRLSTWFRIIHAIIMGVALFALGMVLQTSTKEVILTQVTLFDTIWLLGLFFFGFHLILLGLILRSPGWISVLLIIAGIMYIADTNAYFLISDYGDYKNIFLSLVAIPSVLGEMSLAVWLLLRGGKDD